MTDERHLELFAKEGADPKDRVGERVKRASWNLLSMVKVRKAMIPPNKSDIFLFYY
jgi:hypothetical protein